MKFLLEILKSKPASERQRIQREWDRQRNLALTPSHLAEVDAIFGRHM